MKKIKRLQGLLLIVFCMVIFHAPQAFAAGDVDAGTVRWGEGHQGIVADSPVVYNFSLEQSGKVAVTYTLSEGDDWYRFVIRDKAGNNLVYEYVHNGTHTVAADLLAGDYEIAMWQYTYMGVDMQYSFVPSFKPSGETTNESYMNKNNEVTTATDYKLNKSITGQFALNDDTDIYKVKLTKNGFLKLTVSSQFQSMDIAVQSEMDDVSYKEEGVQVGKHTYTYFCPKGTYYITMLSGANATGTYSLNTSMSDIPATSVKKVTNVSSRSAKISWTRKSSVTGYQIQYSTDKKFKKGNKYYVVNDMKASSAKIYSLKLNKKYYVRVRTYSLDKNGKKYYSKWSSTKTVTVKK